MKFLFSTLLLVYTFANLHPVQAADCNENGIEDTIELESGDALDCNGNGIPDSCDLRLELQFEILPGLEAGGITSSFAAGDIDLDGEDEFALFLREDRSVEIRERDATGVSRRLFLLEEVSFEVSAMEFGEVSGDGLPDLLLVRHRQGSNRYWLSVCLGDGSGSFAPPQDVLEMPSSQDLELVDLDADGDLDVLARSRVDDRSVTLLRGDGEGGFEPIDTAPFLPDPGDNAVVSDWNGDGLQDLVVVGRGRSRAASIFLALPGGEGYGERIDVGLRSDSHVAHVAAGDFDGDTRMDLALTVPVEQRVEIWTANEEGSHELGGVIDLPGVPLAMLAEDVDGNGRKDLIIEGAHRILMVLLGRPDGLFEQLRMFPSGGGADLHTPRTHAFSKSGSSATRTLYRLQEGDTRISIHEGDPLEGFSSPRLFRPEIHFGRFIVADIDADLDTDLALGLLNVDDLATFSTYLNQGDGSSIDANTPLDPWRYTLEERGFTGADDLVQVATFNGDALPDFVEVGPDRPVIAVTSRADGGYIGWASVGRANEYGSACSGDFDGDGVEDIAVGEEGRLGIHLGDGQGGFPLLRIVPGPQAGSLASGDLDGDGTDEIIFADREKGTLELLSGAADPQEQHLRLLPAGGELHSLGIEDLDGDGHPELVAIRRFPGAFVIFPGLATGGIGPSTLYEFDRIPGRHFSAQLLRGNLDGTGEDDLVFVERGLDELVVLLNPLSAPRIERVQPGFPVTWAQILPSTGNERSALLLPAARGLIRLDNLTRGVGAEDCDGNGIPDTCDLVAGRHADVNSDGRPDVCEPDCDGNGIPDSHERLENPELDCNGDGQLDACEVLSSPSLDCDSDGRLDACQLASGEPVDLDRNGVLDSCQRDCDENGIPDTLDLLRAPARDCNFNGVPDSCDIQSGFSEDRDEDAVPDDCEANPEILFRTAERHLPTVRVHSIPHPRFPSRIVDLDGDGEPDLLGVHPEGLILVMFPVSHGKPRWGTLLEIPEVLDPQGHHEIREVLPGDYDGDGLIDLAVTLWDRREEGSLFQVYRGRPDLFFDLVVEVPHLDAVRPEHVGDLDGDGRDEILEADPSGSGFRVLFWESGLDAFSRQVFHDDDTRLSKISVQDHDGDGRADIFRWNHSRGRIWYGLEGKTLRQGPIVSFSRVSGDDTRVGDLDGDGHPDLIVANVDLHVKFGREDGRFDLAVLISDFLRVESHALGDLDRDGHLDILATLENDRGDHDAPRVFQVIWGRGDRVLGALESSEMVIGQGEPRLLATGGAATIDLDRDGSFSPVLMDRGVLVPELRLGRGLVQPSHHEDNSRQVFQVLEADPQGSGAEQIFAFIRDYSQIPGRFQLVRIEPRIEAPPEFEAIIEFDSDDLVREIRAGDFDGDGRDEWLVRTSVGPVENFRHLESDGTLVADALTLDGFTEVTQILDVDLDGDDDIVVKSSRQLGVLSWDPAGETFELDFSFLFDQSFRHGPVADFDGDGHLDLVIGTEGDLQFRWGRGAGRYSSPDVLEGLSGSVLEAADADGDGDLDVYTTPSGGSTSEARILFNRGGRVFLPGPVSLLSTDHSDFDLADLNHDGLPDLVFHAEDLRISRGRGDGRFAEVEGFLLTAHPKERVIRDLDGDGRLDILAFGEEYSSILFNETPIYSPDDCNENGIPDGVDIELGASSDVDENGVPDSCQRDCNRDGVPDSYQILAGEVQDCNGNEIPDSCDLESGQAQDCDGNGILDDCDLVAEGEAIADRNGNGTLDRCEETTCRRPGDCTLDDQVDLSDAVCILRGLFLANVQRLPCSGGDHEAPGNLDLLDWQGDGRVNLADAIAQLLYLFQDGAPHVRNPESRIPADCIEVLDCP